jgi:hypothetical protein
MTNSSSSSPVQTGNGRSPGNEALGLKLSPAWALSDSGAGTAAVADPLGRHGLIDRTQYIRLLEQSLSSLGFNDVAQQLEQASGVVSQPPQVSQLQHAVLSGDWDAAIQHTNRLDLGDTAALKVAASGWLAGFLTATPDSLVLSSSALLRTLRHLGSMASWQHGSLRSLCGGRGWTVLRSVSSCRPLPPFRRPNSFCWSKRLWRHSSGGIPTPHWPACASS